MMPNPAISLIFVNYRSVWPLSLALKSLFSLEKHKGAFEVIVVNNDPQEQKILEALAQVLPFRLLDSGANIGFGQAANQGAALARGRIVGFINPDTVWQKPILSQVEDFFSTNGPLTILGATLFNEEHGAERFSSGKTPRLLSLLCNNLLPGRLSGEFSGEEDLDWVSGCGLFIPQKTFLLLGGFAKEFFLYFEDVDLCVRAKKYEVKVIRDPRFTLLHRGGKSFSSRKKQKENFYTSQLAYFQKHRPRKEYLMLRFLHQFRFGL